MSGAERTIATASQTVGPFFAFGLTTNPTLGNLRRGDARGEPIALAIRVLDGAEQPVPDAAIEIWHADGDGRMLFGRLGTDRHGVCLFETVHPVVQGDTRDAAHVNICLFMRGLLRHMYTRLYFAGDTALERDPVLAQVPVDRRATLIAQPDALSGGWRFDVRLQGDRETVYFDL